MSGRSTDTSRSPDAAGFAAARDVCRQHARSFYFASVFLPKPKRDAAYAVYAFCRLIDDAVDDDDASIEVSVLPQRPPVANGGRPDVGAAPTCGPTSALDARLELFRATLNAVYTDRLALPAVRERSPTQHVLHAFARTVHDYAIPRPYFEDLADGCRMDLTVARYATWAALEDYCYHVAGVVGLIMSCVFGLRSPAAREQAVQMGNAMQLTNILRDVREDWEKGRVYLPQEDLARFNVTERDLAAGVVDDRFAALMRFEIARARHLYRSGAAGLCHLADDGSRLTASAMAVIYAGILRAIERQRYDVFTSRAHLTTVQKLARVPKAIRLARAEGGTNVPDVF